MNNDKISDAGIGDPYWYEWTVGLQSITKMLSPENGIVSVTLQASKFTGWDDVVVRYDDGHTTFYQVKHTRQNDSITFGDLVTKSEDGKSLLSHLVSSWSEMSGGPNDTIILFTNRVIGRRNYTIANGKNSFVRPPLDEFLNLVSNEACKHKSVNQFQIPTEWKTAWQKEWLPCFDKLTSEKACEFIRKFNICTDQPGLDELEKDVLKTLSAVFAIDDEQAREIFKFLDNALRTWTTTRRRKEEITREDVYEVLTKSPTECIGNHFLVPPEPFFNSRKSVCDDVLAAIRNTDNKVVFLCGSPGVGKTSVLSRLMNRRDRDIDLRYYTFTPISPDNDLLPPDSGRTCTSRALWCDLLAQLRTEFKGEWAKLNIPIRADFIKTVAEIRGHVIRLARELSKRQRRRTVICIDGVDHAARAEIDKSENYLMSLIPPDSVPEELVFVIGGQPPESYPLYPIWLQGEYTNVQHVAVPPMTQEDIEELATHEGLDNAGRISSILLEHTAGNTLSVLYAIATVKSYADFQEAIQSLARNRLKDGINTYYNMIWEHCESHCKQNPSLPGKIAAVFALTSARLQAADFVELFSEVGLSTSDWELLLQRFSPVLANDPDGYRVRFNDIKVFFTRQVNLLPARTYQAVAWALLDLYKKHERFKKHLHSDIVKLLRKADRVELLLDIVSPEFIIEGYLCGTSQKDVEEQLIIAIELSISARSIDSLHLTNCCSKTFARIYDSYYAPQSTETNYDFGKFYQNEFRVINKADWNKKIIDTLFEETLSLFKVGECQRAEGLWKRWMSNLSFDEFIELLPASEVYEEDPLYQDGQRPARGFTETLAQLGRIYVHLTTSSLLTESSDNTKEELEAAVCRGVIEELDTIKDDMTWYREFRWFCSRLPHYHQDIRNLLIRLFRNGKYKRLQFLIRRLKNETLEPRFNNFCLLVAYLGKNKRQTNRWLLNRECLIKNISQQHTIDSDGLQSTFFITITGILLGWQERHMDASINTSELWNAIKGDLHDDRYYPIVQSLIRSAVHIGQWLKEIVQDKVTTDFVFMKETLLKRILTETLDLRALSKYGFISTKDAELLLLSAITYSLEYANSNWRELFRQVVLSRYSKIAYDNNFSFCWKWLQTHGFTSDANDLILKLLGEDGAIWAWSAAEIMETLQEFRVTTEGTSFSKVVENALQKSQMHCIHFSSHKEYCVMDEIMWLKDLVRHDPKEWKTIGLKVLALSERIADVGDNRTHYEVETILVLSALKAGPQEALLAYLQFGESKGLLPRAINQNLKEISSVSSELVILWILCCGFSARFNRADFESLPSLSEEIRNIDKEGSALEFMAKRTPYESNLKIREHSSPTQYTIKDPELTGSLQEQLDFVLREHSENGRLLRQIVHLIAQQHLESSNQLISRILAHLLSSNGYSTWEWAGLGQVHQAIFPLLSDEQKWLVAENLLARLSIEGKRRSPHSISEAIEQFCSYYCAENIGQVKKGLERLLKMHTDWLTAFGTVSQGQPRNIGIISTNIMVNSLEEFSTEVLIHRLASHSCIRIEGALRSLFLLITEKPTLLDYVKNTWHLRSLDQQEYLLMLFEPVLLHNTSLFKFIEPMLLNAYAQPCFSIKLQAFLVFHASARVLGLAAQTPAMRRNENLLALGEIEFAELNDIKFVDNSIFLRNTEQLYSRRTSFLDTIPNVETNGLKEKALYLLGKAQEQIDLEELESDRDVIDGDLKITNRADSDLFNDIIEHQIAMGQINAPLPALAQALLTNDDTNILLVEEYLHEGEWPAIYSRGTNLNENEIFPCLINFNLPAGYEVIAGYAKFPRDDLIHFCDLNTYILKPTSVISQFPLATTFNGRSSFVYDRRTYQAIDFSESNIPLFIRTGGISRLQNFTSRFIPSIPVFKYIGIDLDPNNPFKIMKDKAEVGRLQILTGSNEETGRRCSQLRMVQRWIIKKKVLSEIKVNLKEKIIKTTENYGKRHVDLHAE